MLLNSRPLLSTVIYACIGVFYLLSSAAGQSTCASGFISEADLSTVVNDNNGNNRPTPEYGQQRVIPDIAFTCSGTIIKWIVGAEWQTGNNRIGYPHLQIWRTVDGSAYTLVGSTVLNASAENSSEIYERTPDFPLEFQNGDVLGIFQPGTGISRLGVYHEQGTGSTNYFVSIGGAIQPPSTNFSTASTTADSEMTRPLVTVEIKLLSTERTTSLIFHPSPPPAATIPPISDTPMLLTATSFLGNDVRNSLHTMLNTVSSTIAISFSSIIADQSVLTTSAARVTTPISSSSQTILPTPVSEVATTPISSSSQTILPTPVSEVATTSISSSSQTILPTPVSELATTSISSSSQTILPTPVSEVATTSISSSSQTVLPTPVSEVATTFISSSSQTILVSEVATSFISSFPQQPVSTTTVATSFTSGLQQPSVMSTTATSFSSSSSHISASLMDMVTAINSSVKISEALEPTVSVTPEGGPETQKMNRTPVIIAATVSIFFVGLIASAGLLTALVVRHRKKRIAFYNLSLLDSVLNSGVHNPSYQGVTSAIRRTTSSASYNMYAIPDQQNHPQKSETDIIIAQHYEIMDSTLAPVTGESQSSEKTAASRSERIYETPAKNEELLYAQLKKIGIKRISEDTVRISEYLGSGQFGVVSKGEWESPDGPVEVAVKTTSDNDNKIKLLQEATIMGQFSHPNIVHLHGMVISKNSMMIVLELLPKGDLRQYLKALRPTSDKKADDCLGHTLLSFCRQIASGLSYLAEKAFVHRDLAARNILVDADSTCKVADFGMSRDLVDENYYTASAGKIPVKWTAPEALHFKKYSTASDVWSYGVLMYEIWSLGHKPYEEYTNHQTITMLDSGHRLPPPSGCPRAIYDIMIKCWHPTNCERPDAAKIAQWLSRPDPQLLRWSEEDRAVHPEASLLGAELKAAKELYKELQETYRIKE